MKKEILEEANKRYCKERLAELAAFTEGAEWATKPEISYGDCEGCKYFKANYNDSYHDFMWCRDCNQKDHYQPAPTSDAPKSAEDDTPISKPTQSTGKTIPFDEREGFSGVIK